MPLVPLVRGNPDDREVAALLSALLLLSPAAARPGAGSGFLRSISDDSSERGIEDWPASSRPACPRIRSGQDW